MVAGVPRPRPSTPFATCPTEPLFSTDGAPRRRGPTAAAPVCVLLSTVLLVACKPRDEIRTYETEPTAPPAAAVDADELAAQLDHFLVAIVPGDQQAWFLKLSGRAGAIERHSDEFIDLLASLDPSGERPTWTLPEGWEEKPATEMRLATLVVPDSDGPLELAISSLPQTGTWDSFVFQNTTRWLRQLGQPPLAPKTLARLVRLEKTQGPEATVLHLRGRLAPSGMGAMPGGHPPVSANDKEAQAEAAPQPEGGLTYTTPDGWRPGMMSSVRKAAFRVPGEAGEAEVTVTQFPAPPGSPMADLQGNIDRWIGQLGATAGTVEPQTEPVTVSGTEGTLVTLVGDAPEPSAPAMLSAMVPQDGNMWFFKLAGPRSIVEEQRTHFQQFLDSVTLPTQ